MYNTLDLSGQKINRLTVVRRVENNKHSKAQWLCKCDCGNEVVVIASRIKNNLTHSCGCYKREKAKEANILHRACGTAENRIWKLMKDRCTNPNNPQYKDYGGRGIKVCDRWLYSFELFLEDMGERPSSKHSIDRVDNSKGYSPDNCRWATGKEQGRNKRSNYLVTYQGQTKCISEWAEIYNIKAQNLHSRIVKLGWPIDKALTTPFKKYKKKIS